VCVCARALSLSLTHSLSVRRDYRPPPQHQRNRYCRHHFVSDAFIIDILDRTPSYRSSRRAQRSAGRAARVRQSDGQYRHRARRRRRRQRRYRRDSRFTQSLTRSRRDAGATGASPTPSSDAQRRKQLVRNSVLSSLTMRGVGTGWLVRWFVGDRSPRRSPRRSVMLRMRFNERTH
jgi:hypothetical protein